ncbi:uncharacterized protein LOC114356358 [Ostrinia furnacalis]|uniref:uncharacterized protein LOC114356358 n=1 Tax=Ostrinia furnacalis TaxID=93504 RepID=UPI00103FAEF8|nr:uncharacterized protein LOC114356358 [Ostrinia furnacalis]
MTTSSNNFPFEMKDLDPEEADEIHKHFFKGYQNGFMRVGPKGYFFTNGIKVDIKNIYNMPIRPDDTFVVTFPKSGTTWTQELVWMVANNLDYEKSDSMPLHERFPFLEMFMIINSDITKNFMKDFVKGDERLLKIIENVTTPGTEFVAKLPSPRFIKSHLPFSLLPPNLLDTAKVVYVARDPRDAAVSYYHHNKLFDFMGYTGDFKQYWEFFIQDKIDWTPFFPHVIEAWEQRNHPNLLFLFYEDMLKDLPKAVRQVAEFLGKTMTDEQVSRLCDRLKFDNFKKNPMLNFDVLRDLGWITKKDRTFVRKGKSGDWREHFDEQMAAQAQRWIADNLRGTDLRFPTITDSDLASYNKNRTKGRVNMDVTQNNNFPLKMEDVEPEQAEHLMKYFTGELTGFVRVGPKGYFLPHKYRQEAANIYNMPLRPTDIFIASYPRSGTTWTQELVWMVANDLDYATSDAIPLTERYPFLEFSVFVHPIMKERFKEENSQSERKLELLEIVTQPGTEQLALAPSPRFVKTHLPMSLLPPNLLNTGRVVYVARDPRDVAVSFYHLNRLIRTQGYVGDFKTYWKFFIKDLHHWTPYFEHLKEAWEQRHHPHMLFLFYEELSKDLPTAVRRVARFLNKNFSDEEVDKLCSHLSIENFKNNKSVNYDVMKELGILIPGEQAFIRKGKAGGWRDYFDEEMTQQAQQWIDDNLRGTDLRFPHMDHRI